MLTIHELDKLWLKAMEGKMNSNEMEMLCREYKELLTKYNEFKKDLLENTRQLNDLVK